MTLQDLLDQLEALPVSARTAIVVVVAGDYEVNVESVDYSAGTVLVRPEKKDDEG
jgi:2-keto-3-deoxy-L-rhamnonate aldolase RhmA